MERRIGLIVIGLIVINCFIAGGGAGGAGAQADSGLSWYQNAELGYSFAMPEGWSRISEHRVAIAAAQAEDTAGVEKVHWEAAFEDSEGEQRVFRMPYLMVRHHKAGSVLYRAISAARKDEGYRKPLEKTFLFDEDGNAFSRIDMEGVKVMSGHFLGKRGLVQVFFYSLDEEGLAVFDVVAATFQFVPNARWLTTGEKIVRESPKAMKKGAVQGLLIGCLLMVAYTVRWLYRRFQPKKENTQTGNSSGTGSNDSEA